VRVREMSCGDEPRLRKSTAPDSAWQPSGSSAHQFGDEAAQLVVFLVVVPVLNVIPPHGLHLAQVVLLLPLRSETCGGQRRKNCGGDARAAQAGTGV
jgi:hypothetical protein